MAKAITIFLDDVDESILQLSRYQELCDKLTNFYINGGHLRGDGPALTDSERDELENFNNWFSGAFFNPVWTALIKLRDF